MLWRRTGDLRLYGWVQFFPCLAVPLLFFLFPPKYSGTSYWFIAAALYLLQFRELKAKRFGPVFLSFPPLERLDSLNRSALVAGFPALTAGVLLAVGYTVRFAGGIHVDKAQVVWGLFTWLVVGAAVWLRVVRHWAGRRAAVASIAAFAAVLLVYLALKLSAPGAERFL